MAALLIARSGADRCNLIPPLQCDFVRHCRLQRQVAAPDVGLLLRSFLLRTFLFHVSRVPALNVTRAGGTASPSLPLSPGAGYAVRTRRPVSNERTW